MAKRNLPYHNFDLTQGINTKFVDDEQATRTLSRAINVDMYETFRGLGKSYGTSYFGLASVSGFPVGIHFWEYISALDGSTQRRILSAYTVGSDLFQLDGTRETSLLGSVVVTSTSGDNPPISSAVNFNDQLFIAGHEVTPSLLSEGPRIRPWGLTLSQQTTKLNFDTTENWVAADANSIVTDNTTNLKFGRGSQELDKTGVGTNLAGMNYTPGAAVDLSDGGGLFFLWAYFPPGQFVLNKLDDSPAAIRFQIREGANLSEFYRFARDLVEGWNLIQFDLNAPDSTIGVVDLSLVDFFGLTVTTENFTDLFDNVIFSWGYTEQGGEPTAAINVAAGNLNDTYRYKLTVVDVDGFESNAGNPSNSVTPVNQQVDLTWTGIFDPPNEPPHRIRIYREDATDGQFKFIDEIDGDDTTYTDNIAEGGLQPPEEGDLIDNSPPPQMEKVVAWENRIWGIESERRFVLKYSEVNSPRAWPVTNELQFQREITNIEEHFLGLLVFTSDQTFIVTQDGVDFAVTLGNPNVGCNGIRSSAKAKGGVFILHEDRFYFIGNSISDPWFLNGAILDQFAALPSEVLARAEVFHDRGLFSVGIALQELTNTPINARTKIFMWQYGTSGFTQITGEGPGTDPQDLRVGGWIELDIDQGGAPAPLTFGEVETGDDLPAILFTDSSTDDIWRLRDPSTENLATSISTNISYPVTIETNPFPIGNGPEARGEMRFIQINGRSASGATLTVTVEYLSGANGNVIGPAAVNTVTLTAGDSSPIFAVPSRTRGWWARIRIEHDVLDEDFVIHSLRAYYIPRGDFSGERAA